MSARRPCNDLVATHSRKHHHPNLRPAFIATTEIIPHGPLLSKMAAPDPSRPFAAVNPPAPAPAPSSSSSSSSSSADIGGLGQGGQKHISGGYKPVATGGAPADAPKKVTAYKRKKELLAAAAAAAAATTAGVEGFHVAGASSDTAGGAGDEGKAKKPRIA